MSQTDAILADLMSGKSLTQADAIRHHRCYRLAAVIHALRMDGFQVISTIETHHPKRGRAMKFARYTLTNRRRARSLYAQRAKALIAPPTARARRK